jgi:hypothetical protein
VDRTSQREDQLVPQAVVVVADVSVRHAIEQACRAAGASVLAVSSVAGVERWPLKQVVITDAAHCTPWWRFVGAAEVIVLVRDGEEGAAALANGATRWLQPPPTADVIAAMVLGLSGGHESRGV